MSKSELKSIVQREVESYAKGRLWKAMTYPVCDLTRMIYSVVSVPDYPRRCNPNIIVMARIQGSRVVIDEDVSDRPLVNKLIRAGVPRENIVLIYAGEKDKHA